jgi:hypothetical protein
VPESEALIAFARERHEYQLDDTQIAGIHHAMAQADRGEFASDASIRDIFWPLPMRVRVTDDAASDLRSIKDFLAEQSVIVAERVLDQIANVIGRLHALHQGACLKGQRPA